MSVLWGIVVVFLISTSALGFGKRICGKRILFPGKTEKFVIQTALGYGIISVLTFLAAALNLLHVLFFIIVLAAGNVLLLLDLSTKSEREKGRLRIRSLATLALIVLILINFFFALFPPTFHDVMVYHLAVPSFYIMQGGFAAWNTNYNSNLPLQVEMLFLFALLGNAVHATNLISLFSAVLIVLLLSAWFSKSPGHYGIIAALLFFSIPQVGFLSTISNTDMTGMLFMLVATRIFLLHLKREREPEREPKSGTGIFSLILSGLAWGFALASKYSFFIFFAGFLLALLIIPKLPMRTKWKMGVTVSVVAVITLLPWMIKTLIFTGNPVYPYLTSLFPNPSWNDAQIAQFSTGFLRGEGIGIKAMLLFPLNMFLKPYRYGLTSVLGILYMIFLPFLFFRAKCEENRFLFIFGSLSFALLLFFARVPRFFLPSLLLLALPIVSGLEAVSNRFARVKPYLFALFFLLLLGNSVQQVLLQEKFTYGFRYLTRRLTPATPNRYQPYLHYLPPYRALEYINHHLTDDDRVLFLGEDRTFYIKKPFLACSQADQHPLIQILQRADSPRQVQIELRKHSISYLLLNRSGLKRYFQYRPQVYTLSEINRERLDQFLNDLPRVYQDMSYEIFTIDGS